MAKKAVLENEKALQLFFSGEIDELTQEQLRVYERIDFADGMIRRYGGGRETAKRINAYWSLKVQDYNLREAYRDMGRAQELWAGTDRRAKEANKVWAVTVLKREVMRLQKFETDPPKRAMAIAKLMEQISRIEGFENTDDQMPNFSEIGAVKVEITTNTLDIGIEPVELPDEIRQRYEAEQAHDIDFKEVNE